MNKKEIKKQEWERVVNFYQQIDGGEKNEIERRLASKFLNSIYAEHLYPFVSHRTLCISPTAKYTQIEDFPMISILHLGNSKFRVKYWQKLWRKKEAKIYDVEETELWNLLDTLLQTLITDS